MDFKVGDGVSWAKGTDTVAGTVSRVGPSTIYVREDKATLQNGTESGEADALHFSPGGFVGHTSGEQRYAFEPGSGPEMKFTKRKALGGCFKLAGASSRGSMQCWGSLYQGRDKHYDFNF